MPSTKAIARLSFVLAILIILCSCAGLLIPGIYAGETANWQAQTVGQDIIDLFIVPPILLLLSVYVYRNNKAAMVAWGGVIAFITYTFTIYCFSVHFNNLFILYCCILGISIYTLCYFIYWCSTMKYDVQPVPNKLSRATGIYFISIAVIFYCLWMSEIIPAIAANTTPLSVQQAGLPTNPVHVIDLSVFLPASFLNGIILLKRDRLSFLLAPALLSFFILMDINIAVLNLIMRMKGFDASPWIEIIMTAFAIFSAVLLVLFTRHIKNGAGQFLS